MRKKKIFETADAIKFKNSALRWCEQYEKFAYLDSNSQTIQPTEFLYSSYDVLIAFGSISNYTLNSSVKDLSSLDRYISTVKDWLFGYISYDLKNCFEELSSDNKDNLHLPLIQLFQPEIIISLNNRQVTIWYFETHNEGEIIRLFNSIEQQAKPSPIKGRSLVLDKRITQKEYLKKVEMLLKHIKLGDIYEINFCQEFYKENIDINPLETYYNLKEMSPTPFSCMYKNAHLFLLCASPERFLKRIGQHLLSQPIKGTIKRLADDPVDNKQKETLANNPKEKSENVMITDLVRNDLSRIALKNTVKVDELCAIYSFKHLHHMISTISCILKSGCSFTNILESCFPMGSMTGAPKVKAMELIEKYESTCRGIYSGTFGYIEPNGNFDFNVIIRSMAYNQEAKYLSYQVGSAITVNAQPEKEYEECLLKADGIDHVIVLD